MSAIYLLPCHGDNCVEITTAEAGRTIACPCGKKVQVPTLREIRQLPRRREAPRERAAWSPQQGVLFSLGLVLCAASLGFIGWLIYQRLQLDTEEIVIEQERLDAWDAEIMGLEAAATLDGWNRFLNRPLPEERRLPQFEVNRAAARVIVWKMVIAGVVALVGLCLMGASTMLKPGPATKQKTTKSPKSKLA